MRKDGSVGIKRRGEQGEEQEGEEEGRVVYVNPVEMMEWKWEEYKSLTGTKIEKARKGDGVDHQFPKNLVSHQKSTSSFHLTTFADSSDVNERVPIARSTS